MSPYANQGTVFCSTLKHIYIYIHWKKSGVFSGVHFRILLLPSQNYFSRINSCQVVPHWIPVSRKKIFKYSKTSIFQTHDAGRISSGNTLHLTALNLTKQSPNATSCSASCSGSRLHIWMNVTCPKQDDTSLTTQTLPCSRVIAVGLSRPKSMCDFIRIIAEHWGTLRFSQSRRKHAAAAETPRKREWKSSCW